MRKVKFKRFDEATEEDVEIINENFCEYASRLPQKLVDHLKLLGGDFGGFQIDRLQHSLQTATRAHRDGKDEEYVVCALLHDIGDTLAPYSHGALAGVILRPFVNDANHFMVTNHGPFQGYHYYHKQGRNRNERGKHSQSPHFEHAKEFVDKYDMPSFDDEYVTLPLEFFIPMIERVMVKKN